MALSKKDAYLSQLRDIERVKDKYNMYGEKLPSKVGTKIEKSKKPVKDSKRDLYEKEIKA